MNDNDRPTDEQLLEATEAAQGNETILDGIRAARQETTTKITDDILQRGNDTRIGRPSQFTNNDTGQQEFYQEVYTRENGRWEGFVTTHTAESFAAATRKFEAAMARTTNRTPAQIDKEIAQAAARATADTLILLNIFENAAEGNALWLTNDEILKHKQTIDAATEAILVLREAREAARQQIPAEIMKNADGTPKQI